MGLMDRVADSAPAGLRRARPSVVDTREIARNGLEAAAVPTRFEWGIAVVALFVLGRWPVLFLRIRLAHVLGAVNFTDWPHDGYVRAAFIVTEVAVAAVAVRQVHLESLRRLPALLAFLGTAWASTIWSVEPGVTISRALILIGVAVVGWYVGERFTIEQLAVIMASVGAVGAGASYIAVLVVPKIATVTGGASGHEWSGVYYNRNELGLVLCGGLLSSLFLLTRTPRRLRGAEMLLVGAEVFMLAEAGNRTGPMALAGAFVVCGVVFVVRRYAKSKLVVFWGSVLSLGTLLIGYGAVEWQWKRILEAVGRNTTLTARVGIWWVDRSLIGRRPWFGFGFESIWSHAATVEYIAHTLGRFPYTAHNGYYEVALGVGYVGLAILAVFLTLTLYRAFIFAWRGRDLLSLWPLAFVLYVLAINFTESLFVSGEALLAVLVGVAFALSRTTTILVRRPTL